MSLVNRSLGLIGAMALLVAGLANPAPAAQPVGETVTEVRVHGNHTTPDGDVLALAGLTIGQLFTPATLADAERRLRESGRFASVEIRKRYRSLDRLDQVALVIVVREHPVVEDPASPTPAVLKPLRRLAASGMLLPILSYADGYGFTYGARVSFVHLLGRDGRVSVPLTWGATRRAAFEIDKRVPAGPVDRLTGGVEIWRRENPFYERHERRSAAWLGASGRIAGPLRAGARGSMANVRFNDAGGDAGAGVRGAVPAVLEERLSTYGVELSVDTRHDPVFPRDALSARVVLEALRPEISGDANRRTAEARAYLGLVRQAVLSGRWQYSSSDAPLPPYERALLGGAASVRGVRGRARERRQPDGGIGRIAPAAELAAHDQPRGGHALRRSGQGVGPRNQGVRCAVADGRRRGPLLPGQPVPAERRRRRARRRRRPRPLQHGAAVLAGCWKKPAMKRKNGG